MSKGFTLRMEDPRTRIIQERGSKRNFDNVMTTFIINKRTDSLKPDFDLFFYNETKPKLMSIERKKMQDAIATKPEFHRYHSENHGLVN